MTAEVTGSEQEQPTPFDSDLQRRAAAYRRMRSNGPVVPMPGLEGALAAVSYEAVDTGLRSVEDFGGSAGQDDIPDIDKNLAAMVEPRHGKVRRIMNSVVAFHRSERIEPYLQELVTRLLDAMLAEAAVNGDEGV